ncbi:MAG: SufD family Fe-S cluster assembly protein, partial [Chitinophagaceae bacterium]|nr:SufD family Fe-S cluster assembly protein [Chitinophagaceae bacterium]
CSHGSTVGQFSPEALFYLQSRGIGENAARTLLVNAFAADVTDKIPNEPLRKYVEKMVGSAIVNSY